MNVTVVPFAPKSASTITITAETTSSAQVIDPGPGRCRRLRIYNAGPNLAFVEVTGSGGAVSSATGMPIPSGEITIVTATGSHLAAVTTSGSATLYVTPGEGG